MNNETRKHLQHAAVAIRAEIERLKSQLDAVEKLLAEEPAKRGPGHPPGSGRAPRATPTATVRAKPNWSPAAREEARARMKAYWALRKKGKTKGKVK